jgi:hypothetical protein
MKLISDNEARQLMTMFMDGATSNAEERQLYEYFANKRRLPDDLKQHKEMMSWYAAGLQQPEQTKIKHINWKILTRVAASICVLVVTALSVKYFADRNTISDEYAEYAGSYVIENGIKTTDLKKIMPQLKNAEQIASANISASDLLNDDPVVQSIIDDYDDEDIKNFIIETLYE